MAKSKQSFDRLQRERAKKAKADAKRERRLSKDDEPADETTESIDAPAGAEDESALLGELAELHKAYDEERISFDDFDVRRTELLSRLQTD